MTFKKTIFNMGGVITTILTIVSLLIVLGYFWFNLRNIVNSPVVQYNLAFAKELALNVWNTYLKVPITYVYDLIVKLLPK